MNARLYFATENAGRVEPIEELSVVRLKSDIETSSGVMAAGSSGTVVAVYGSGEAYMVEFNEPFHALETLNCEAVEAIPGRSRADILADIRAVDR